jgi:polysaccharide biosynthesis transport protein
VSKNFDLMSRAGLDLRSHPVEGLPSVSIELPREQNSTSNHTLEENTPEWLRAVAILAKHWRLSAAFAAMVFATAAIVTFNIKPTYEPTARLEVDPPGETFSLNGNAGSSDAEYLETQSQNLKNTRLALAVVRKLDLAHNPEIVTDAKIRNNPQVNTGADGLQLTEAENFALAVFQSRLTTKRDSASRLITVSFSSHDPLLAAQVTNAVLDSFIEQTFEDQSRSVMKSTQWLSKQLDDIRQRMDESSRVLAEYQKSIGVADLEDNKNTFAEQLGELSRQLMQAQADRIQMQALLSSVKRGSPDSLPEVRNNPLVQQLGGRLADIKTQLSQAMVTYGPNHPTVKKLQTQADELEKQLSSQKMAILSSVNTNFAAANAREQLMSSQIKGTTQQLNEMGRYNALKKEAQANAELYNSLYSKVKEAGIAAASRSSNLRVVDEARVLSSPTRPNRILNLAVGLIVGLLGGVTLAFLREHTDSRIFTVEDIRHCIGGLNVAILPQVSDSDEHRLAAPAGSRLARISVDKKKLDEPRFFLDAPSSPEAEALRSLCTSMMLANSHRSPQVLLVVSSFPGEGKTTVAMNLAMAMARQGKTCIVDADLRRGRVATACGVSIEGGLTDVLEGSIPLDQVLIPAPNVADLTVLPSHSGNVNAGQLVCSEGMRELVRELRLRFQYVIIDTAPLLPFADGQALSTVVDGLVFVGRSGITTRDAVRRSLELLQKVHGAPILQFVLNGASVNSADYQYYQQGHDYYGELSRR